MIDARTTNPRDLARAVQEWGDLAQAAYLAQPRLTGLALLRSRSDYLRGLLAEVFAQLAVLEAIWEADGLARYLDHATFLTLQNPPFTWEELIEQAAGLQALKAFADAQLEVLPATKELPAVTVKPKIIVTRTLPPPAYWGNVVEVLPDPDPDPTDVATP